MKVHGLEKLDGFRRKHADGRSWIEAWLAEARATKWATPNDVKARYSSASFLAKNTVVFNVKGNKYRLVTGIAYQMGIVVVKWIGTHDEYTATNWEKANDEASSRKD